MDKIKAFILDYIQREYTIPEGTDINNFNYVTSGYVDSLGFIQFIAVLEDEFAIQFSIAVFFKNGVFLVTSFTF